MSIIMRQFVATPQKVTLTYEDKTKHSLTETWQSTDSDGIGNVLKGSCTIAGKIIPFITFQYTCSSSGSDISPIVSSSASMLVNTVESGLR